MNDRLYIPNNRVACTPLESNAIRMIGKDSGFARPAQKTSLYSTKVVYPPSGIGAGQRHDGDSLFLPRGTTVYIRADTNTAIWTKEVYTLDGVAVMLVPIDQIQAIDYTDAEEE